MRKLVLILVAIALCGTMAFASGTGEAGKKNITVAYLTPGLDVPFWRDLAGGIHKAAEKIGGITIIDMDSRNSAATQLKNAQDMITKGVNAIIISPTDSGSCPPVLDLCEKNKMPVIVCDIGTDSGTYNSFVISDNYGGANAAGKYIADVMKKNGWQGGEVGMINISMARVNGQNRYKGFKDAMDAAGSKIVVMLEAKDYTRAESNKFAQDMITAHPNLRAIFTAYDEATLGTVVAVETAGRQKDMVVAGFDGSPESIQYMKESKVGAMAIQQGVLMGRRSLELAMDVLNGKTVTKRVEVPTFLVTMENLQASMQQLIDNVFPDLKK
jgi:ABC-type sugar transport system substrate-binding protein